MSAAETSSRRAEIRPVPELTGAAALRRMVTSRIKRRFVVKHYTFRDFEKHKCIFVHVPKAAGISVCECLFGNRGGAHNSLREYRRLFVDQFHVRDFDRYFKFAFVRNPWDRCYSAYTFMKGGGILPQDAEFARQHILPFRDFAEFVREWLIPENIYLAPHFTPQMWFLADERGEVGVDFLGRFENINEDYEIVRQRLGFGRPLEHRNRTAKKRTYVDAYDDQTRDLVGQVYAADIERLGYTFGLTQKTAQQAQVTGDHVTDEVT